MEINNTRAQKVEYLKLYQDLLARFAVGDRKIGSAEQAAISFIDVNANSVLDATEQASLNSFNSKLNVIINNSATHLDSSGNFNNSLDLNGLNGTSDDKNIFDRIVQISESVYDNMEKYLVKSLGTGTVPILGTSFNDYDVAQLLEATKNGRENYLYPIVWSNDASRIAQMAAGTPSLNADSFRELFNGNRATGVLGLFDEGVNLGIAKQVLNLIDSGITDVNRLKFYGKLLSSGLTIAPQTLKLFDNLWNETEFSGASVNPFGQITLPDGSVDVQVFYGGAGSPPAGAKLNHLMNILLRAGDPNPSIALEQRRYLMSSLEAGSVAITGKDVTYDNLMELNDAIPDTVRFNKLHITPWITKRPEDFPTTGSPPPSVITEADFRKLFDEPGPPISGLFDQGFRLDRAKKLLELFDAGIKDKDSLKFYSRMMKDDNDLSPQLIFLLESYRNSLEPTNFTINPSGELIATVTDTPGTPGTRAYSYATPVFAAPVGATPDEQKQAFALNQFGQLLFKKIAPRGATEPAAAYEVRLQETKQLLNKQSRLLEKMLADPDGNLMITNEAFSYENVMDIVLAEEDLAAETITFNLATGSTSVEYYADPKAKNKLYAEGWSNDASRIAQMAAGTPSLNADSFRELFNGNRATGVLGLFDEGVNLGIAKQVLNLIDSGITDVNRLKFYGKLLSSGLTIAPQTLKLFDNLWNETEFSGASVNPFGQITLPDGSVDVQVFYGGAGSPPAGAKLNHLMNILLRAGDPNPSIALEQRRYLMSSLEAGSVAITGKDVTYDNLMELNDAIPDTDQFSKLKIQYWTESLTPEQLGNRNKNDVRRVFNRLYDASNYQIIEAFQRLLEEAGVYDPSGLNYYRELMEEMERAKSFALDIATFDNAIASSRELEAYVDLNTTNTRTTAADQVDQVWIPVSVNSSHRQVFIDLVNTTGSISKTQAYFVTDIYGTLADKNEIVAYKDACITGGASAHTLSELQKFRIDKGLNWDQTQYLMDLLKDPALGGGEVDPQRARRHELLKEALAFGELPNANSLDYQPLTYSALTTLLGSVKADGSI
jgi:hypothetical protein